MDSSLLNLGAGGLQHLPDMAAALGIGAMFGLERERKDDPKAGLRTFSLIGLSGAASAVVSVFSGSWWPFAAALLAMAWMTISAYDRDRDDDASGSTTVAAVVLCFLLSGMCVAGFRSLSVMTAIVAVMLLHFKTELRGTTRSMSSKDINSALQFGTVSLVALPILPDTDMGPYGAFNPHGIWMMVVLISGLSFAGYIAFRLVGRKYGAPALGIMGGLASSTATTMVYARHGAKGADMARLSSIVILLANVVVLCRLTGVAAVLAPQLLPPLSVIMGSGALMGAAAALWSWWRISSGNDDFPMPEISNPAELKAAFIFAGLYAVVLVSTAWLSEVAGTSGLMVVAGASGLTDVDAITLTSIKLFGSARISVSDAALAIGIAACANMVFKTGIVVSAGGRELFSRVAPGFAMIFAGLLGGIVWTIIQG